MGLKHLGFQFFQPSPSLLPLIGHLVMFQIPQNKLNIRTPLFIVGTRQYLTGEGLTLETSAGYFTYGDTRSLLNHMLTCSTQFTLIKSSYSKLSFNKQRINHIFPLLRCPCWLGILNQYTVYEDRGGPRYCSCNEKLPKI